MQTLHSNATTTYHIRRQIQQAEGSNASVGRRFGVSATTVKRWRNRDRVEDASSSNRILRTTLTAAEEYVVLELRKSLLLPTDDLLRVSHEFVNPKLTRSALGRLLRREGLSQLKDLIPQEEKARSKSFKDYEPGYIHIDIKYLPQMPDESSRRYLFAAIDRATRWVYLEIHEDKSAQSASTFLQNLKQRCPFKIHTILTDNGKEFTDRFCTQGERQPTGNHPFDQECQQNQIEHRLIKPFTPKTNGMIERFNGRIETLIKKTRFKNSEELKLTIFQYQDIYNNHIAQRALDTKTPQETVLIYYNKKPELFLKNPTNAAGRDTPRTSDRSVNSHYH